MKHGPTDRRHTAGNHAPTGQKIYMSECTVCGCQSTTGCWLAVDGEEGNWCIACRDKGIKARRVPVEVDDIKWHPGFHEVKCCGEWIACYKWTNTCSCCNRDFDSSGSELADRRFWGEETGETADEILRGIVQDEYYNDYA